jgi:hypothetical protein
MEVWEGDGDDGGGGGGGVYLLLLRVGLVRMGPRNTVSAGVTPMTRTSSSSSSGTGSGRSATLRGGDGVAARLLAGLRLNEVGRERGRPRATPIIFVGKRRRGGEGV